MTTNVDYNVTDAIKNLNRLNSKVEESGSKAKSAFGKGGKASNLFGKSLDKIPGKAGSVVSSIRGIASAAGPMAAGLAVAAGSIASVVAQFIDFNEIMKDSLKTIEGFKAGTKTIQEGQEAISSLFDEEINRNNELARRAVKLDQADSSARQRALEEEIEAGKDGLEALKDELDKRQAALSEAVKTEEDLRRRLAARQTQGVTDFAGFDADLRAAKLNEEARRAAQRGDIDRAEALEKEAQAVAENAKNRAFAAGDAQKTSDAINRNLEEQINKAETERKELEGQVKSQQQLVDQLDEIIDNTNKRLAAERRITKELAEQQKILRVQNQENRESQTADSAARTVTRGARDFLNNIRFGDTSAFETLKNFPSELGKLLTDEADRRAVRDLAGRAAEPTREIGKLLQQFISDPGSVTAGQIRDQAQNTFPVLNDILAELRVQSGRGELTADGELFKERLGELIDTLKNEVFGGATDFVGARGANIGIKEGTQPASREDMNRIRDALLNQVPRRIGEEVKNAIQGQPSRAAQQAAQTDPAQSQGSPQPTQVAVASTINVNANVKGGIIDAEVTREITRIIKQELRKQTSNAPVA